MKWIAWEQKSIKGIDRVVIPLNYVEPNPALQNKWNKLLVHSIGPNYWQYNKSKEIFKAEGELI